MDRLLKFTQFVKEGASVVEKPVALTRRWISKIEPAADKGTRITTGGFFTAPAVNFVVVKEDVETVVAQFEQKGQWAKA